MVMMSFCRKNSDSCILLISRDDMVGTEIGSEVVVEEEGLALVEEEVC